MTILQSNINYNKFGLLKNQAGVIAPRAGKLSW